MRHYVAIARAVPGGGLQIGVTTPGPILWEALQIVPHRPHHGPTAGFCRWLSPPPNTASSFCGQSLPTSPLLLLASVGGCHTHFAAAGFCRWSPPPLVFNATAGFCGWSPPHRPAVDAVNGSCRRVVPACYLHTHPCHRHRHSHLQVVPAWLALAANITVAACRWSSLPTDTAAVHGWSL